MFTVRITTYPQREDEPSATGVVQGFECESYGIEIGTGVTTFYRNHLAPGGELSQNVIFKPESGSVAYIMNRFGSTVETIR